MKSILKTNISKLGKSWLMISNEYSDMDYRDYLFSSKEKDFLDKQIQGENDNYICELIRKDLVKEFIVYITKEGISVNSRINHSIFESNKFLIGKNPLLIEYAAFHGSIQIFQYLKMNSSVLTKELMLYAIHSKSDELISQIESLSIENKDAIFVECFKESIKCHHNDIAAYIKDTHLEKNWLNDQILEIIVNYQNYAFYPKEKEFYFNLIPSLIKYENFTFLEILIKKDFLFDINYWYNKRSRKLDEFAYDSYIVEDKRPDQREPKKFVLKISKEYPSIEEFSTIIKCNYP